MGISKNIREIIHLTGRMCRRFDGYVTDSFTVTLRNNSWTVIINNNFQKKGYTRNNSFNEAYVPTFRRIRDRQFYGNFTE
jgi:hypothetical protein